MQHRLFEPVLDIVYETMPRDNLLNSACLELFEFIKRESLKPVMAHLVENYGDRLAGITYVSTFRGLLDRYHEMKNGVSATVDETSFSTQGNASPRSGVINGGQRWQSFKETDAEEEAYFNTSDGEDDEEASLPTAATAKNMVNGNSPVRPLVAYPDDEEDAMDLLAASPESINGSRENAEPVQTPPDSDPASSGQAAALDHQSPIPRSPPERLSEKRRREEDEEDDLAKLAAVTTPAKRRNSLKTDTSSSPHESGNGHKSATTNVSPRDNGPTLRRKGSLRSSSNNIGASKLNSGISISFKHNAGTDGKQGG